jgi:NAD-dependent dihydropyrimidine dehydrogenase PreA subunit
MDPFEQTSYRQIRVGRVMVGMNGLDEIFSALYADGREPDKGIIPELLGRARQHNYIPSFSEDAYIEALLRAFQDFCWQKDSGEASTSGYGTWRGHPRAAIPWFPTINDGRCDGCGACVRFCPNDVFATAESGSVQVVEPLKCQVGCSGCVRCCKPGAITFPPQEILEAFEKR